MDTLRNWVKHPVWVPIVGSLGFFTPVTIYYGFETQQFIGALMILAAFGFATYQVCRAKKKAEKKKEVTDKYLRDLLGNHYKEMSHLEIYPGFIPIGYVETPDGKKHFLVVRGDIYEKVGDS